MKVPKAKALAMLDQQILRFQELQSHATFENRFDDKYSFAYHGTESLLGELFSQQEPMDFRMAVTDPIGFSGGSVDKAQELADYKRHLKNCAVHLKVYREKIDNFWSD